MGKRSKRGGESNQAVIIALVFFVILCIGLAVATFTGFSEQANLEAKIAAEQKTAQSQTKARDYEKFLRLMLQAAAGHPLSKDDEEALGVLYKEYTGGKLGQAEKDRDEVAKMLNKIQNDYAFDPAKLKFNKNFAQELRLKDEQVKMADNKAAAMNRQSAELRTNFERRSKTVEEELNKLKKVIEDKEKGIGEAKNNVSKQFAELTQKVKDWIAEREKLEEKHVAEKTELQNKIEKLKKDLKIAEERYQKTIVQIKPVDMTVHDEPKGKILRLSNSGATAYIDLGFADNVKPQLKFSVYPAGSTKAQGERKAAVEVVSILAAHLSAARITEMGNGGRIPIVANDVLFNPAWSPTLKQHIAIAGRIDLTGDGTDNTDDFMRDLEKQSIVIDAYMDLKDREYGIKGEMTYRTNFLVLGDVPTIDRVMAENDPRFQRDTTILARLSEMQNKAGRLGVTIVPARRFMALIGYKTPKSLRGPIEYGAIGNIGNPAPRAAEAPRAKPKDDADADEKPKAKAKAKADAMDADDDKPKPKAKAKAKAKADAMNADEKMDKPKAKAKAKADDKDKEDK